MSSKGVNKVILVGNLGQDPEVRFLPSGEVVANFTVATSESWLDAQGQPQEHTEWHRLVAFKRLAEIVRDYLHKGSKVYLEGKLQTREWVDQQGQKRYTTEIVCHELQMLDPKPQGGPSYLADQSQQAQQQQPARQPQHAAAPHQPVGQQRRPQQPVAQQQAQQGRAAPPQYRR